MCSVSVWRAVAVGRWELWVSSSRKAWSTSAWTSNRPWWKGVVDRPSRIISRYGDRSWYIQNHIISYRVISCHVMSCHIINYIVIDPGNASLTWRLNAFISPRVYLHVMLRAGVGNGWSEGGGGAQRHVSPAPAACLMWTWQRIWQSRMDFGQKCFNVTHPFSS